MLDKFLGGRPAPIAIGAEQGGINEWDDVVIQHVDGHYEHLQIKRQSTPFCNKAVDKAEYLASYKHRKAKVTVTSLPVGGDPKASAPAAPPEGTGDSELDSAFRHLATWYGSDDSKPSPERAFTLTLVGAHIGIKKDLTVNHLDEFCKLCRQDGLDLEAFAEREDGPTKRVYLWLTSWCGFKDWNHVQRAMRRVTVKCIGNDAALEERALESLGRHFSSPQQTLDLLVAYITENTSDVAAIRCHAVVRHLQAMLKPDVETWTQYLLNQAPGNTWSVAGTHDVRSAAPISTDDAASEVVKHHWAISSQNRKLRLHAQYAAPTPNVVTLPSAILRLALHLQTGSHCLLLGESVWRSSASHEVGRTLGIGDRDLDDLPWIENTEALTCALSRDLPTQGATRLEAAALAAAMDELVWQRLQLGVSAHLASIVDTALMSAMEATWLAWVAELTADPEARQRLIEQMMYPATEGKDPRHALRIGPRTVALLETAIVVLLLVGVAIGGPGATWRSFPEHGDVLSIALRNWSGPAADTCGARALSDDDLISVIGPSPASVVILSGVDASPTSLLEHGMADDFEAATSMAAERQPQLLVTRFGVMRLLRKGTLASVQLHFEQHRRDWHMAREAAIKANGKGA
ncbi:hypothetical protein OOT07_19045 [Pseudomonas aeruginosa]|nr:hypothetical protein [Pseudomonas aeruginosa]